jgi:putative endonuclease
VRQYYVYIMTNKSGTLYVGVTGNLARRVYQHKHKLFKGFTARYNINRLVYYESTPDVRAAIGREKQIKGWLRAKKVALIEGKNRDWKDLSAGWFEAGAAADRSQTLRCAQGDSKDPQGEIKDAKGDGKDAKVDALGEQ